MTPLNCDVLVAGAGIIGATIALRIADHGLHVACAGGPATAPGTASGAAGAMLGVLGEVTAGASSPLDTSELQARHHSALRWPVLAGRIEELTGLHIPVHLGTTVIATASSPADRVNLTTIQQAATSLGLPCEPLDPGSVAYLHPAPGHEAIQALWLPAEGYLDTSITLPALHQALAEHPRITRIPATVSQVTESALRATGAVMTDGTVVRAGHTVLAAGVSTQILLDQLAGRAGVRARLLPGKGTSLVLHEPSGRPDGVIRTPNREFACGTHLIPRAGGQLYLGATNRIADTPGAAESPSPGELHALTHSAIHEVNTGLRTAALIAVQHGMRPLSSDGYPLIGPTSLPGLYLATGTYRNGLLLAPAIADAIAACVGACPEGVISEAVKPFAPTAGWRDAAPDIPALLNAGVPHLIDFLLGPTGQLPYNRQNELQAALRNLLLMALTDDPDPHLACLRERCTSLLRGAQVPEVVPQVFYELSRAADDPPAVR